MKKTILLFSILFFSFSSFSQTLIPFGDSWKYLDDGSNQDTLWRQTSYSDATWSSGNAQLGYGDGDESTVVSYGGNATNKFVTTYFRKSINIPNVSAYGAFTINLKRDDGVVVYVNGKEEYRDNMPTGNITYTTFASAACADDGNSIFSKTLSLSNFVNGSNVIAVEIHQNALNSSDISFDFELLGVTTPSLTRGPYLQLGTSSSVIVRWRTDIASDSRVNYGTTSTSLSQVVDSSTSTTEHIVQLSGLTPSTKYYYSFGSSTQTLQGDTNNYFITAPTIGTEKLTRVWLTGDCGTAQTTQTKVLNEYLNFSNGKYTDLWLLLGDNAYNSGFDSEYQTGFFQPYQNSVVMKQTVIFPAPGNHDYLNTSDLNNRNTPYFQNFTVPIASEIGGIASGTESYYSYNYSNIHFVSLDSYGTESNQKMYDTTSAQTLWLKQDLAANTQKWTILYWHHPPYTKGSHNSDTEGDLVTLRNNMLRIIDRYKVDLVVCGHSHCYERSKLLKGHYGLESTFDPLIHWADSSSAEYDGTTNSCAYIKNSSATQNEGIVYVVAGSAGKFGGTSAGWPHNAMYYSNATNGGSLALEINGNRLDAKFISDAGVIQDKFTIMKDVGKTSTVTINAGQSATLTASWNGTYDWNNTIDFTQSINVTPSDTTLYVVNDTEGCLADSFFVNVIPVSIHEYTNADQISIYPNPTNGKFQVSGLKFKVDKIEVYNVLGEIIYEEAMSNKPTANSLIFSNGLSLLTIDLLNHPTGVYFLKITSPEKTFVKRFVVEK